MIDQTKVDDKHKPETQSASTRPGQFDTLLTTRSKLFAPKPGGQAPLPDSLEFTDLQPKKASSSPDDASYLVMTGLFGDNTPGTGKGFTAEGEKKKVEPGEDKSSEGKGVGGYGKGRNGEGTPEYDKTKTQDVDRSGAAGYGKGINGEGTPEYEQLKKKDGKDLAVGDRKNGPEKESDRVKLKDADGEKEKLLARVKAFEDKYNVKFGQEGEAVAYRDKKTTCRLPSDAELDAFEKAFNQSQPSNRGGLRIELVNDQILPDAAAFHVPGRIVFQPSIKGLPALDNPDRVYGGPGRNDSLVATITHELAHRLQWRTDPQFGKLTSVSPEQAKIGVGLGFRKVDVDGATKWLLEAKGDGKVPVFYTQIEDKWNSDWARCTAEGKLIFDEKKPSKLVSRISNDEMREQMKVPAPTTYLRNPTETTADLVTAYRLGGASLKNLIANYPEAHAIARDLDRADIIKAWGADEKGEPKYVRINDRLVANSPEARQKLQDFEEEARKLHGKERAKK